MTSSSGASTPGPASSASRLVVTAPGEASHEAKGSRFLALCLPVATLESALEEIARFERRERRATHVCWAMRISGGPGASDVVRSHDAGEPSGTAGRPILAALEETGAWNGLVLVARVFGGVKLGAPGLKRAYHRVALDAVRAATLEAPPTARTALRLRTEYAQLERLERLLARHGAGVVSRDFDDTVHLRVEAPPETVDALRAELPSVPAAEEGTHARTASSPGGRP